MAQPPLIVRFEADGQSRELRFHSPFRIGRVEDCEVCIKNDYVSRQHAEVVLENGQWRVRDLNSSNGIFVDGQRVETVPVEDAAEIRLGIYGPIVSFLVEKPPPANADVKRNIEHYFGRGAADEPAGERTMFIRQAFQEVQKKQKRKYGVLIAVLAVAVLAAGGYAFYLHQQTSKQRALAQDLFYSMKSLDVDIANLERVVTGSGTAMAEIRKYEDRRRQMRKNYDRFLSSLHVYDRKMTPQDRIVLRVARIFGECELDMPPGFATEVGNYINKWKSSGRLARDIQNANYNGYTKQIASQLLAQDLPPQFFYLALQESDFDPWNSGPPTRKGIAKGMWQFIPETALKYGLKIGPLAEFRRPDPGDDRHHFDRETKAAAQYLKDLYSTDAQASGLLVMACYNWGEDYVLPLVRSMPANPKERNFWQLLAKYRDKIPQETYDYVFSIASAAAIGENPRQFGFDFDNPLGYLDAK